GEIVDAYDFAGESARVVQFDFQLIGAPDDVSVGEDVAVRSDDDTGSGARRFVDFGTIILRRRAAAIRCTRRDPLPVEEEFHIAKWQVTHTRNLHLNTRRQAGNGLAG